MSNHSVVRVYESELEEISHEVLEHPDIETGGDLIGLWSHADAPTVVLAGVTVMLASSAAPGSRASSVSFEQDPAVHRALERLAWERYGFQAVGIWHSHHSLDLHRLSDGDVRRTMRYSSTHRRPRYCELLAYLLDIAPRASDEAPTRKGAKQRRVTVGIRPHVYADAASGRHLATDVVVLPGMSPLRQALAEIDLPSELQYLQRSWRGRRKRGPTPYVTEPAGGPRPALAAEAPDPKPISDVLLEALQTALAEVELPEVAYTPEHLAFDVHGELTLMRMTALDGRRVVSLSCGIKGDRFHLLAQRRTADGSAIDELRNPVNVTDAVPALTAEIRRAASWLGLAPDPDLPAHDG